MSYFFCIFCFASFQPFQISAIRRSFVNMVSRVEHSGDLAFAVEMANNVLAPVMIVFAN